VSSAERRALGGFEGRNRHAHAVAVTPGGGRDLLGQK